MSTEIDWSKAPEDATHYNVNNGLWYRTTDKVFADIMRSTGEWDESVFAVEDIDIGNGFIPRHVSANQEVSTEAETATPTETLSIEAGSTKHLLGLTPKNLWEEQMQHQRRQDIHAAMQRYIGAGKDIPNEWLEELMGLNNILAGIETDFDEAIQSLPVAEDGEWIEWGKEEEPDIPCNTIVEKVYSDGDVRKGESDNTSWFGSGGRDGKPYVVTRYRIISEGEQE